MCQTDFKKLNRGFSYVELIFTVAILALLAGTAAPYLEKTIQRKKEAELRESLRDIRTAIDAYKLASDQGKIAKNLGDSGYPKHLEDLENGVVDVTDPQKKRLRFIRKLPSDPMYKEEMRQHIGNVTTIAPADTWGKRSYESDADNPRDGADVYDVYSLNTNKGLNGIPYNAW